MDTIRSEWLSTKRIGNCVPTYDKNNLMEIEDYIIFKSKEYEIECKYNVGCQTGGIPPKGDKEPIVNPTVHAIKYADVMGGILISTRNSEVNCRNVDNILYDGEIDNELIEMLVSTLSDKYELIDADSVSNEVIFLPGSNLSHISDPEKIYEIIIDNPNVLIKPHPIQTEVGLKKLKDKYGDRLIDPNTSGFKLLNGASVLWSTANSEIGLIASLMKKQFGDISIWEFYHLLSFADIYRQFKYKDVDFNYQVVAKYLSSKKSGYVAYWMQDWHERINSYFEYVMNQRSKGSQYPYTN